MLISFEGGVHIVFIIFEPLPPPPPCHLFYYIGLCTSVTFWRPPLPPSEAMTSYMNAPYMNVDCRNLKSFMYSIRIHIYRRKRKVIFALRVLAEAMKKFSAIRSCFIAVPSIC